MFQLSARVAVVLASTTALSGQQAPQNPTFRGGTALVRVDVTVLDADGKPVPGLTAADFEITLDGRVQTVQTVDYRTRQTKPAVNAVSGRQATNAMLAPPSRLVVVLVDDLSIAATSDRGLFHAASRFVASLPDSDLVGLTTTSGQAAINPTGDHAAVEVGLRRAMGKFTDLRSLPPDVVVGLNEAVEIDGGNRALFTRVVERDCLKGRAASERDLRSTCADDVERKARQIAALTERTADMQVATFKAVINAMRPVEGEKALVILSEGLIMPGARQGEDIRALEREGATAGVHVSVLFPEPESVTMSAGSSDEGKILRDDGQALRAGLQNIAGATGGDFYRVIGQPDRFFGFVTDALSSVYHLGVEAPPDSTPGREFKLSVRVRRSDISVRANRVAVHEAPTSPVPVDAQLQAVVARGEPKYGVPMAVGAVVRPGKTADETAVGVNVEVPSSVPGPLTVVFAAVDEAGQSRTGRHTLSAPTTGGDYRLSFAIPVPSASYRLRIGIADAQGQVGGLDMPVVARLNRVGPFLMSDILMAWAGTDGKAQFLSLGKVPVDANSLLMRLELAPAGEAAPPSDVRVTWTIVTEAGQPVAERTVAAAAAGDRLNAQTQASVASLPAGTYELRATILLLNQPAGVTSVTFRKAGTQVSDRPWPLRSIHAIGNRAIASIGR